MIQQSRTPAGGTSRTPHSAGTTIPAEAADPSCDPAVRVTKSLLGYGVIAGPIYVVVSVVEALVRDGFDLTRDEWSLLANGSFGWVHVVNLVLTGLMTVAFAVGLRRAVHRRRGAGWLPGLVALYGVGLMAAGVFRADPAMGFPAGTPQGVAARVSWHGFLHLATGGVSFVGLIAACLVAGHRFAAARRDGWATYSRVTGVMFLAGFVSVAAAADSVWANLTFTAVVVLAWVWVATVAVHSYRRAAVRMDVW